MSSVARADEALVELYAELAEARLPLDLVQAAHFIRAAYVRGYCDSLELAEPPITIEAIAFRDELALRVPVL